LSDRIDVHLIDSETQPPALMVWVPITLEKLSSHWKVLPTCVSSLVLVPMVKLLKPTLSTPSVPATAHDSRSSLAPTSKALGSQTYADTSDGLAQIIRVAQVAKAKFIDRRRTERFRVAQAEQLRAPE
jgi:hypothetical protein